MPYPGGKAGAGIYQRIINQIPPHQTFIEGFAGDLAIFRHKLRAARNIAVEIDPERAQVLAAEFRDDDVEIYNCCGIEFLKHYFGLYRVTDLAAAASSSVTLAGGVATSNGRARATTQSAAGSTAARSTGPAGEFVYLDPPYLISSRRSPHRLYRHEMTEAQHAELLGVAVRIPCPVAISGYWSPLYAEALQHWRTITFTANTRGGRPAREYLWMNYPAPAELHDYRHLGNEKRERERITRKVRTWSAGLLRLPRLERQAILAGMVGPRR